MTNGRPLMGERSVLAGLVLFGALAIVLGVGNFQRMIGRMTAGQRAAVGQPPPALTREDFERQQQAVLVARDTDGDGLSDFDELERTRTSPFLADSDSDGRSDKEEVDAGQDPNCPTGTTCGPAPSVSPAASPVTPKPTIPGAPVAGGSGASVGETTPGIETPTPSELRAALERAGFARELLAPIPDEQLVASYQSMLQSVGRLPDGSPSPFAGFFPGALAGVVSGKGVDPRTLTDAFPKTAPEIRALLEHQGVSREQLTEADDATLLRAWEQVLQGSLGGAPRPPSTPSPAPTQ